MQTEINYLQILQYVSLKPTSSLNYPKWPQLPTITLSPGGGGLLPYIDYMGICYCTGYHFQAFLSRTGYRKHAF